jgi:predicted metal-dependent HD superfamily phosphohydrolase
MLTSQTDTHTQQQRFYHLLEKLSATLTETAPLIWQNLQTAYQQPQRKYHTQQHISECLQLFATCQLLATQPLAVEFALWFHDVVYDPHRNDNEQQSAVWASKVLQQGQVTETVTQQIYELIMATAHSQPPQTNDEKLLVDIDLAILAAAPARFAQYQQQIRAEYAWVAEPVYQQKRRQILTRLYNGGDIYHHPELKAALEASACANLRPVIYQEI